MHVPSDHFLAVTPFACLSSNSTGATWKGPVTAKCQVLQSGLSPSVLGPNSAPGSSVALSKPGFQGTLPASHFGPCFQGGLSFLLGLSYLFECWKLWSSYLGLQLYLQISLPTFMMTTFKEQLFSEPYVLHFWLSVCVHACMCLFLVAYVHIWKHLQKSEKVSCSITLCLISLR